MDYEKLIERLKAKDFERDYDCTPFECGVFGLLDDAATALSALWSENKKLRKMYQQEKAVCHATQAELEQVKRERDEAVHDRMMMEQSVGELSAREESAEADNKKLCAAMMQLKRTDRPNRMSVIYELEYDSSMSHKTMEEVAFIVFKGLMDADLKLRGPKEG